MTDEVAGADQADGRAAISVVAHDAITAIAATSAPRDANSRATGPPAPASGHIRPATARMEAIAATAAWDGRHRAAPWTRAAWRSGSIRAACHC